MRLGTRTRYGARAMLDLAHDYERGLVSVREMAGRHQVSLKYLEHLLASLRTAGLVKSARGAHGGYTLARPPDQINLRQVYNTFEGEEGFVECTTDPEVCERTAYRVACDTWNQMYAAAMKVIESTTLEDLARRFRNK